MPDFTVLLMLTFEALSLMDIAKALGIPVALLLLSRFVARRDTKRDAAAAMLQLRTEAEETERVKKNLAEYERLYEALEQMRVFTQRLAAEQQALKLEVAHRGDASKDTMTRIDNQLSKLIEKFIDRS